MSKATVAKEENARTAYKAVERMGNDPEIADIRNRLAAWMILTGIVKDWRLVPNKKEKE
jgi:hypothetical protein